MVELNGTELAGQFPCWPRGSDGTDKLTKRDANLRVLIPRDLVSTANKCERRGFAKCAGQAICLVSMW